MRLGEVAWTLGVNEKTADNAIRTLGLRRPLDHATVRALGLALRAKHRYAMPLSRAFPLVREALKRPTAHEKDPLVRDLLSYLPDVDRRLGQGLEGYRPLRRGPGWHDPHRPAVPPGQRRHPAVRRAIQWGLDLSLNQLTLRQTAAQRLRVWSEQLQAIDQLRGGQRAMSLVSMWEGLVRGRVRFVVIGGAAGTAHGSARITHDLDVCYDPSADNTQRLVRMLTQWKARLYVPNEPDAELPFPVDDRTFRDAPALSLVTDRGRLDLLPVVAGLGDYRACVAQSEVKSVGRVKLRVLSLDALIQAKRAAGRPRDVEHLIELEALRALRRQPGRRSPKGG